MIDHIGRAFTYVFEDKDWLQKVLLGAAFILLSFLIIPIPFLIGYNLEVARNVSEGRAVPLPKWDQLGDKFLLGILAFIAMLAYYIPLIIIEFLLSHIPCIGIVISIVLSLAVGLAMPYIMVQIARTRKLAPAFDFAAVVAFVSQNLLNLIIVIVVSWVTFALSFFGVIGLIIGVFFTMFYAGLVSAYLTGEVVRISEQGGAAISVEDVPPTEPQSPPPGQTPSDDAAANDSESSQ